MMSDRQELAGVAEQFGRMLDAVAPLSDRRRRAEDQPGLDRRLVSHLGEEGYLGLTAPEEAGGAGLGLTAAAGCMLEAGARAAAAPLAASWLLGLAAQAGEGAAGLVGEVAAGSLIIALAPAVDRSGRSSGVVYGLQAEALLSWQATARVEAHSRRSDEAGLDITQPIATLDIEGLSFEPLGAPPERLRSAALILAAADALGAARAALAMTVDYVTARRQFGRPLTDFQALRHKLADLAADLEPLPLMIVHAAEAFDRGQPAADRLAALTKAHVTTRAAEAAKACVFLTGGMGFTWEYDLALLVRRALFDRAYLGAPRSHYLSCATSYASFNGSAATAE